MVFTTILKPNFLSKYTNEMDLVIIFNECFFISVFVDDSTEKNMYLIDNPDIYCSFDNRYIRLFHCSHHKQSLCAEPDNSTDSLQIFSNNNSYFILNFRRCFKNKY